MRQRARVYDQDKNYFDVVIEHRGARPKKDGSQRWYLVEPVANNAVPLFQFEGEPVGYVLIRAVAWCMENSLHKWYNQGPYKSVDIEELLREPELQANAEGKNPIQERIEWLKEVAPMAFARASSQKSPEKVAEGSFGHEEFWVKRGQMDEEAKREYYESLKGTVPDEEKS